METQLDSGPQRLVAIGDSLTLGHWDPIGGWTGRLRSTSDDLVRATSRQLYAAVYNLGISSDTSDKVLARFSSEVTARIVRDPGEQVFITVAVGINDSRVDQGTPFRDVEVYESNLRAIVTAALGLTERVVVVGLTPVIESLTKPVGWDHTKAYHNERIHIFDAVAEQVSARLGARFAALFDDPILRSAGAHLDWDGLHLSALGHQRVANIVGAELGALGWRAWSEVAEN